MGDESTSGKVVAGAYCAGLLCMSSEPCACNTLDACRGRLVVGSDVFRLYPIATSTGNTVGSYKVLGESIMLRSVLHWFSFDKRCPAPAPDPGPLGALDAFICEMGRTVMGGEG